jgi:phenylacetate-CoA ligase
MIDRYGRLFFRFLRMEREQWIPREELERRQWLRFRRMLRHAYDRSPYYRTKLDEAGVSPEEIRDRSDLSRIPVTKRADLLEPDRLLAADQNLRTMRTSFSSGATGESARTYFDVEAWIHGKFLLKLRARLACGVRPSDRIAVFQADPSPNSTLRRALLRLVSFPIGDPVAGTLRELRRYRPTVLYGPPSYLRRLADVGGGDLRPRLIFTSGETLEGSRESIEVSFGAVVLDTYGSTELKEIAWECPERAGHHVNADWLLVETIEGDPATGRDGDVVVTSLYNFGMPLIRYKLGDTGRLLETSCPCGRTLPLMAPRFGRIVDYFLLEDETLVSPYSLINPVEVVPGVKQFQIVQETTRRALVRVVPGAGFGDQSRDRIRSALAPILRGMEVGVDSVETIEPGPGGKHRIVTSRVRGRS